MIRVQSKMEWHDFSRGNSSRKNLSIFEQERANGLPSSMLSHFFQVTEPVILAEKKGIPYFHRSSALAFQAL